MHLKLLQKGQFKKAAEATGDLSRDKSANKITKISSQNTSELCESETRIRKERYISLDE